MRDYFEQNTSLLNFEGTNVRVVFDEHGEPWWCAKDVCAVLGILNNREAIADTPDDEKRLVGLTDAIGRDQQTTVVNEPGLYRLIFRSRKPEASRFKDWVLRDVLPTLRREGRFETPEVEGPVQEAAPAISLPPEGDVELWLSLVREARRTFGRQAGRNIWEISPLPHPFPALEDGTAACQWADFARDCCTLTGHRADRETAADVRDAAAAYWQSRGWDVPSKRALSRMLREAIAEGVFGAARIGKSGTNYVIGLRLNASM